MSNAMNSLLAGMASGMEDLVVVAAATVVTVAAAGWISSKKASKEDEGSSKKRQRRWSLMSESMAHGTFPPTAKFDEAIINVVMVFDDNDKPTREEIVEKCVKTISQYERFSSVFDRQTSEAKILEDLNPNDLVRVVPLSPYNCKSVDNLLKAMEHQACVPLAKAPRGNVLPWWEFVLLDNQEGYGKSAVVWRIHHSLGDGISLVQVVQDLFFNAATGEPLSSANNPNLSKKFKVKRSPWQWISQTVSALVAVVPLPIGKFDDLTTFRPKNSSSTATKIDPNTLVFPDQQTILPFSPVPLEFVKRVKAAASSSNNNNISVNDLMFTVVSQAIHDYLLEEKDPLLEEKQRALNCRTLLPLALPRPQTQDKSKAMRNFWCFVSCDLSVGVADILDRLQTIHKNLQILKTGLVPLVSSLLSNMVMKLPRMISRDQTLNLFARHSMVLSNVPGPSEAVSIANHEITAVHMIHMNLIPQLSFLSYRGIVFGNAILGKLEEEDQALAQRRAERFPLHVSNAWVELASKLEVKAPKSLIEHAAKLHEC